MRNLACSLALVVLMMLPAFSTPLSPDEVKQIVTVLDADPDKVRALCAQLRADPWGKDALGIAGVLTTYMVGSPKVTIHIGSPVIAPFVQDTSEVSVRLVALYNNGLLQYALLHGGLANDREMPATVAGLTELAAGYANMLKTRPADRNATADRIGAAARGGTLEQYVTEAGK